MFPMKGGNTVHVEVYFASSQNGASKGSFFKLPFTWSATPSKGTETAVSVETQRGKIILKGVVGDVLVTETLGKVLFNTETSPDDLREAVLPGNLRFEEVQNWLQ